MEVSTYLHRHSKWVSFFLWTSWVGFWGKSCKTIECSLLGFPRELFHLSKLSRCGKSIVSYCRIRDFDWMVENVIKMFGLKCHEGDQNSSRKQIQNDLIQT
jgi:hypothetical protein